MLHSVVLTLVYAFFCSKAEILADMITSLPGWEGPLPSRQFSGLLNIPNSNPPRYYHYWLVESENDAAHAPLVFWFNGGPGASSLLGYFTEQGPFNVNDNSVLVNTTEVPVLFYNNYTWCKVANMVFLESPAGVGFSYCDGPEGPIDSCPDWNDTNVAQDNHQIVQQFFKYYPEYMENEFYISGESYAGIYVPTLVMQIQNDPSGIPPLRGIAVGDGCMGIGGQGGCNLDDAANFWQFMWGHSQLSNDLYNNILSACGSCLEWGNCSSLTQCVNYQNQANMALGGYNIYDVYDECYLINDEMLTAPSVKQVDKESVTFRVKNAYNSRQKLRGNDLGSGINQYACGGSRVLSIYLNLPVVQNAIHVANIPWTWQDGNWTKYTSTQTDLRPYYQEWVQQFKVLIYYGDVDAAVPYNGGEKWTEGLNYKIKEAWRPWTTNGENLMGGYVQIYDTPYNFTYLTVRGSGHMVPQFKPLEALAMFRFWLFDMGYPPYTGVPSFY